MSTSTSKKRRADQISQEEDAKEAASTPTHSARRSGRRQSKPLARIVPLVHSKKYDAALIEPDSFEPSVSFYPKVLNASMHPLVASFMTMGVERITARYCHLNPQVNKEFLRRLLTSRPKVFHWGGADLFKVTNQCGHNQMIIIETNSCPSGQKSTPARSLGHTDDGYHEMMRKCFKTLVDQRTAENTLPEGGLAVIYDKNPMENGAYAAAMATVFDENVFAVEFHHNDPHPPVRWNSEHVMEVRDIKNNWHPIRAAFRYVTQSPWKCIPVMSKTLLLNPTICCLAGGRNKLAADLAYELLNNELKAAGLAIRTPRTIRDVEKNTVPMWVKSMGGKAVVKNPYSNAGQGVYTITNAEELKAFMNEPGHYNKYIVQSLVGNAEWSSSSETGVYFHAGTIPNRKLQSYCADLRLMVCSTADGWMPVAGYSRRAEKPLKAQLQPGDSSWEMLGTNLSFKNPDGSFGTDSRRLLLLDQKDFNMLGISIDDLIEGYIQTVLSTTAIDRMCQRLLNSDGSLNLQLYSEVNQDQVLLDEIRLE